MSINVASQLAVQAIQVNYLVKQLFKEVVGKPVTDYVLNYVHDRIRTLQYDLQARYDIKNEHLIRFVVTGNKGDISIRTNLKELLKVNNVEEKTAEHILGLLTS